MAYKITRDYISYGNSRPGTRGAKRIFIVAHDTGNPGSTAYGNRNWFNRAQPSASAHTFIDDNYILEMIPLWEKAWHVIYNVSTDDRRFGDDANDAAIGVELCWGGGIDFDKAYRRYVWYMAYLCKRYNLNPRKDIVGHEELDPARKIDPSNALNRYGVTFNEFIDDVAKEYNGKTNDGLLTKGDSGAAVRKFQRRLIKAGYKLPRYGADGGYGSETIKAVKRLQRDYDLLVDGIVGDSTRKALKQALKGDLTVSERKELNQMKKDIKQLKRQMGKKAEERQIKGRMYNMFDDVHKELDKKIDEQPANDTPWPSHADNVKWAKENNISNGKNPHMYISREQVMTMLKGLYDNIYVKGDEAGASHADTWQWAIDNGITNGDNPHYPITREQVATMLKRYDELNEVVLPKSEVDGSIKAVNVVEPNKPE